MPWIQGVSHDRASGCARQIRRVDAARNAAVLQSVMKAVNNAPDGDWIGGSEEQVRDLLADFRRQVFEKAVQLKVDAAEAAFPPLRTTRRPASVWRIKVGKTSRC
jgi:hypothetical protein